jgi:hypothetical protein
MKPSALLLAIFFLTACASSNDGFVDDSAHTCTESGQKIEIEAGLQMPGAGLEQFSANAIAHVQLSNNSDDDVVVKSIRVDPRLNNAVDYELQQGFLEVNGVLKEAESEQYEIPLMVRDRGAFGDDPRNRNTRSTTADLSVMVVLANGETYRCQFRVAVPVSV